MQRRMIRLLVCLLVYGNAVARVILPGHRKQLGSASLRLQREAFLRLLWPSLLSIGLMPADPCVSRRA